MTDGLTQEQKDAAAATAAAAEKAAKDAAAQADAGKGKDGTQGGDDPYKSLALPQDSTLDPKALDRVRELATSHKLTPEAAQALVDTLHREAAEVVTVVGAAAKKDGALWKARVEADAKASLEDPLLGNGSPRNLENVRLKAELYLNQKAPEFKALLEEQGLLANPVVLKYLQAKVKEQGEDTLLHGDRRPAPQAEPDLRDRYNPDGSPKEPVSKA